MTGNHITLPDWYQLDIEIRGTPKSTMQSVFNLVDKLKSQNLIERWFYLYENTTVRLRFSSKHHKLLEQAVNTLTTKYNLIVSPNLLFQTYWEDAKDFPSLDMLEAFANVMFEVTALSKKKFKGVISYSNYTLVEKLSHCIFNNVFGTSTEGYFLLKRLGIKFNVEDNPEQTILDAEINIITLKPSNIQIPLISKSTK